MSILIGLIALGFGLLVFGANRLVDGASAVAKKLKVSDLAIGLTIVAFGTSAPELVVSIIASVNDNTDIVIGNVVGSNNFNLFMILGISGLILPINVQSSTAWREIPFSLFAVFLVFILMYGFGVGETLELSVLDSVILLSVFSFFLFSVFKNLRSESIEQTREPSVNIIKAVGYVVLGLGCLILGGKLVVENAVILAKSLNVSEKMIGLTIVAAGTSLPELVTSVIAAMKKNSDIAIGNVIGSNIFNLLLIVPVSSLITTVKYNPSFNIDFGLLFMGTTLLILFMLTGKKKVLDRWEAALLLLLYIGYTFALLGNVAAYL